MYVFDVLSHYSDRVGWRRGHLALQRKQEAPARRAASRHRIIDRANRSVEARGAGTSCGDLLDREQSRYGMSTCSPNERAGGDGGIPTLLHAERARPALPEHKRSAAWEHLMRSHV